MTRKKIDCLLPKIFSHLLNDHLDYDFEERTVGQMLCVNFWLDLMMMLPLVLNFYESVVLVLVFLPPSLSYYSLEFLFWEYKNYSGSH